jgi:hypothetical protein
VLSFHNASRKNTPFPGLLYITAVIEHDKDSPPRTLRACLTLRSRSSPRFIGPMLASSGPAPIGLRSAALSSPRGGRRGSAPGGSARRSCGRRPMSHRRCSCRLRSARRARGGRLGERIGPAPRDRSTRSRCPDSRRCCYQPGCGRARRTRRAVLVMLDNRRYGGGGWGRRR